MAELTAQQRLECAGEYMREESQPCAVNKTDLRAAFNALDTFFSANAATLNSTIPQPARSNLTTEQKARLLVAVIRKRYLSGV